MQERDDAMKESESNKKEIERLKRELQLQKKTVDELDASLSKEEQRLKTWRQINRDMVKRSLSLEQTLEERGEKMTSRTKLWKMPSRNWPSSKRRNR